MTWPNLPQGDASATQRGMVRTLADRIQVATWDATTQAPRLPLAVQQGATLAMRIEWVDSSGDPRDTTGHTAAAQIRKHPSDAAALVNLAAYLSVNTAGVVTITVPAAVTAVWDFTRAAYDVTLTNAGTVTRILSGTIDLLPAVTQ